MPGAIIILLVTLSVGLLLYMGDLRYRRNQQKKSKSVVEDENGETQADETSDDSGHGEICCGRHLVCEKSLSPMPGEKPVYYDDEELDRFAGKEADSYSESETEEFREILLSMLPSDVPGWVRSLQLRNVAVPQDLRDELFMILGDDDSSK